MEAPMPEPQAEVRQHTTNRSGKHRKGARIFINSLIAVEVTTLCQLVALAGRYAGESARSRWSNPLITEDFCIWICDNANRLKARIVLSKEAGPTSVQQTEIPMWRMTWMAVAALVAMQAQAPKAPVAKPALDISLEKK